MERDWKREHADIECTSYDCHLQQRGVSLQVLTHGCDRTETLLNPQVPGGMKKTICGAFSCSHFWMNLFILFFFFFIKDNTVYKGPLMR